MKRLVFLALVILVIGAWFLLRDFDTDSVPRTQRESVSDKTLPSARGGESPGANTQLPRRPLLPGGEVQPNLPKGHVEQPAGAVVSAQAVDPFGNPYRRVWMIAEIRNLHYLDEQEPPGWRARFRTDELGGFKFPLGKLNTPRKLREWEEPKLILTYQPAVEGGKPAWAEMSPFLHGYPLGETDLGLVRFREDPQLVSGRVVDSAGIPLVGVMVKVEVRGCYSYNDGEESIDCEGEEDGGWVGVTDLGTSYSVTTNGRGEFRIYNTKQLWAEELAVVAVKGVFAVPVRQAFKPGDSHLLLTLRQGGFFGGAMVYSAQAEGRRLVFRSKPVGGPGPWVPWPLKHEKMGRSTFKCGPLLPGKYALQIGLVGEPMPIHQMAGIEVAPGLSTGGKELATIDLRPLTKLISIGWRDGQGKSVKEVSLRFPGHFHPFAFQGGVIKILGSRRPLSCLVLAKDRGSVFIPSLVADQEVVLPPILTVRLKMADTSRLAEGIKLGAHNWTLGGLLFIPALNVDFTDLSAPGSAYFDESGIAEFKVALPGYYWFSPEFTYEDREGSLGGDTFNFKLDKIDFQVRKGLVKQTIHVPLAWSTLADMVKKAGAKGKK